MERRVSHNRDFLSSTGCLVELEWFLGLLSTVFSFKLFQGYAIQMLNELFTYLCLTYLMTSLHPNQCCDIANIMPSEGESNETKRVCTLKRYLHIAQVQQSQELLKRGITV